MWLLVCSTSSSLSSQTTLEAACSLNVSVDQNRPNDCSSSSPTPFTCSHLQQALAAVNASELTDLADPVCVSLTTGPHSLTFTDTQIEYSVHIIGSPDGETVVHCLPREDYTTDEFPLKFGASTSVIIEGVDFTGCARPLLFNGTDNVTIEDSHFSNFTQTALEIYNTASVTIINSTFTQNICKGQRRVPNSGNAVAVSIGYGETYTPKHSPLIEVMNCTFTGNEAKLEGDACGRASVAISQQFFTQRGGGLGCYFSAPGLESEVRISDCVFEDNTAEDSGGGIYMNLNGNDSTTTITITDSQFINNMAMHGAGVEITFDTPNSVDQSNHLTLQNCYFEGNQGYQGGGMKLPQINERGNLNYVHIIDCWFSDNTAMTGAAIHMETFITGIMTEPVSSTRRVNIDSSSFVNNTGRRGIAFFSFNHVNFMGTTLFLGNTGPSLRVRGSLASWEGDISFCDNQNHPEGLSGAVHVSSFSQLLLNPGVNVSFINNTGQEGAAVVVQSPRISSGFARTLQSPQCFVQFSDSTKPPDEWEAENVSVYFEGNRAAVGPNLFITSLNECSWFNYSTGEYGRWNFVSWGDNYVIRGDKNNSDSSMYLQTQIHSLLLGNSSNGNSSNGNSSNGNSSNGNSSNGNSSNGNSSNGNSSNGNSINGNSSNDTECPEEDDSDVSAYPGQNITVNVMALDQFNHSTTGFLRIMQNESSGVRFTPPIVHISADSDKIDINYVYVNDSASTDPEPFMVKIESAFSSATVSTSFVLRPISCPPGYKLNDPDENMTQFSCMCDVSRVVLACDDPGMEFVLLKDGLWGAQPSFSRSLVTYPCPPQYCDCTGSPNDDTTDGCALVFNDSSASCTENRTGVLCGECMGESGVGMLSMECRQFTVNNMYYWPISILVLFVVVSVVTIVKVGVAIPPIYFSFLFYIQISSLAVASFTRPFRLNTHVMTCLSSFISLYVPYDFSLHSGLTALEAYGLRYISPLLALLVAPVAAYIRYHPRSWNGIWTLLLLMYGMATETAASLLFCPTFTTTTNSTQQTTTVWFYDGSVSCYEEAHLGLAIPSLLSLILLTLVIPALTVIAYQRELSVKFRVLDRRWLERLSLSLTSPYHPLSRWWLPLELARRLILILSLIFCPGYVSLPLLEAGLLLLLVWYVQPYKDWRANASEAFSTCVLVVLMCLGNTNPLVDLGRDEAVTLWPVFYLPLAVAVAVSVVHAVWATYESRKLQSVLQSVVMRFKRATSRQTMSSRRFTESLIRKKSRKKNSVRTTEVGFEDALDFELDQL
jgi:predicted outer membrane repeat protein